MWVDINKLYEERGNTITQQEKERRNETEREDLKKSIRKDRGSKSQRAHILQSLYGSNLVCKRTDNKMI